MIVEHDFAGQRFSIHLPEGRGDLFYRFPAGGVMELYRTEVDTSLRGRGVGGELASEAADWARAHGQQVRATCAFVAGWLARNPEHRIPVGA